MYNEELKRQFISEYAGSLSTNKVAARIFRRLKKYEEAWEADFCTKTAEELYPVVDVVAGVRTDSISTILIILREYVKWCIAKDVPGACDGMLHIKSAGIGKIRERMVASPLHLKTYLNSVFDPVTDETIDVTFHSFFWLIYAGIDEKDVMDITKDQIDFENMEIHHKTVNYPIYIEAVPALKKAISLTKFRYKHPMYDEKIVIFKDRLPGDKILRGITGDKDIFAMKNHIAHKTANAIKAGKSELRLSTNRAELSGIFHRLYDRERAGLPISFTEYAIRRVATNTPDVFKNKEEANRRIRKAERDYLNDYTRWKLAFSS